MKQTKDKGPKRPLCVIAAEIKKEWKNVYFGAKPYLDAMLTLNNINDKYFFEDGEDIVRYFLANAAPFRGEVAIKLKDELREHLKQ